MNVCVLYFCSRFLFLSFLLLLTGGLPRRFFAGAAQSIREEEGGFLFRTFSVFFFRYSVCFEEYRMCKSEGGWVWVWQKFELIRIEMSFAVKGGRIKFSVGILWKTSVAKVAFCLSTDVCRICRTDLSKISAAVASYKASWSHQSVCCSPWKDYCAKKTTTKMMRSMMRFWQVAPSRYRNRTAWWTAADPVVHFHCTVF